MKTIEPVIIEDEAAKLLAARLESYKLIEIAKKLNQKIRLEEEFKKSMEDIKSDIEKIKNKTVLPENELTSHSNNALGSNWFYPNPISVTGYGGANTLTCGYNGTGNIVGV